MKELDLQDSNFYDEITSRRALRHIGRFPAAPFVHHAELTFKRLHARNQILKLVLLCASMAMGLRGVTAQTESRNDLAVVVNPHTPVDNISLEDLRKIFLGERQFWSSNVPVVPLIRPQGTLEREVVLRVLFKMTEIEYKKYWITKVFRAEATNEPTVALTNSLANDAVAAIPGSVTIENAKDVPRGAKILKIDGHKPGDPGYPLR